MINELFDLSESLQRSGIRLQSWHRHFKECPQGGKAFYVELDTQGHVAKISRITDPQTRRELRKYEKAAGDSFPSFNIKPLLQFENGEEKERAAKFRKLLGSKKPPDALMRDEELAHLLSVSTSGWIQPDKTRRDRMDHVNKSLSSVTEEVKAMLDESADDSRSLSFVELLDRAQKTNGAALHEQLKEIAIQRIKSDQSEAAEWMDVLFFHSGKSPQNIAVTLELVDQSQFSYPANHPEVQTWVSDRLLSMETSEQKRERDEGETDAFGIRGSGMDEKFPEVKMPLLNSVKLYTMSHESPCQSRYGRIGSKSFRVNEGSRQKVQNMKNALEWVTRDERYGKTWCDVSLSRNKKAVLIAYPSELPPELPSFAGIFSGDKVGAEGRFDMHASRVIEAVKGQSKSLRDAELSLFVLNQPDGYRTEVLYSHRYSVQHLLDSAGKWQALCRNSPPMGMLQWIPYPSQVVWCLNTLWKRHGKEAQDTFGFHISDGITLLLEEGPLLQKVAIRAIRAITSRSLSLLLALGQALHQEPKDMDKFFNAIPKKYKYQTKLFPYILGLLLGKLDFKKGVYMQNSPYLIGRLLSLVDQLHVQYCHGVRKGKVPSQLVGNAFMTTALATPEKALASLWQRIKPYHAWAQTVQGGDEVRLAKYLLGEIQQISVSLSNTDIPSRCSDTDKVAMLLGYLARNKKKKSNDNS